MSRGPVPAEPALRRLRLCSAAALALFGIAIAIITMWPGPPDPDGQSALREFLIHAYAHGFPRWITFGRIEFASNIVMFVPIGLFGALTLPRHRWAIVPAAALASAGIETIQAMALPLRYGTVLDVIANTLGAFAGYLIAAAVVASVHRRMRRRAPFATAPVPAYR